MTGGDVADGLQAVGAPRSVGQLLQQGQGLPERIERGGYLRRGEVEAICTLPKVTGM